MLKEREVQKLAKERAGIYIPILFGVLDVAVAPSVALLSVAWMLQQVSQAFGDSSQIQSLVDGTLMVFGYLICVLWLLGFPLITLLDIGHLGPYGQKQK